MRIEADVAEAAAAAGADGRGASPSPRWRRPRGAAGHLAGGMIGPVRIALRGAGHRRRAHRCSRGQAYAWCVQPARRQRDIDGSRAGRIAIAASADAGGRAPACLSA